jgi:Flp pilus assembly protein TadG
MENICKTAKGQTVVLVAIMLVVLIMLVGLALDIGMMWGVKAKLNAAVDMAALAAAKVLGQGRVESTTQANNYFNANYPNGLLGATVSGPNIAFGGTSTVTVSATASVPTNFARVIGWNSFDVPASASAKYRLMDMMLVLDCSASLKTNFGPLKAAAKSFVDSFNSNQGGARIGLVAFSSGAQLIVPINKDSTRGFDLNALDTALGSGKTSLTQGTYTASAEGMRRALYELDLVPQNLRSSFRTIVFFSDGAPNTIAGTFSTAASVTVIGDIPGYTSSSINTLYTTTASDQSLGSVSIPNLDTLTVPEGKSPYTMDYTSTSPPSINIPTSSNPDSLTQTVNMLSYYGNTKRSLSGSPIVNTVCNVNYAARNMVENVANTARGGPGTNAVTVFTIGLGDELLGQEVPSCYNSNDASEYGQNILQRLANVNGVDTYNPNQSTGIYVHATDGTQLNNAFSQVKAALLRLCR